MTIFTKMIDYEDRGHAYIETEIEEMAYHNEEQEPLDWCNSAKVQLDPKDDAVHFCCSVGDPRGAMVFTVRRLSDGRLVVHVPHTEESFRHVELKDLHPGTMEIVG